MDVTTFFTQFDFNYCMRLYTSVSQSRYAYVT